MQQQCVTEEMIKNIENEGYAFAGFWMPTGMELCLVDRQELMRLRGLENSLLILLDPIKRHLNAKGEYR